MQVISPLVLGGSWPKKVCLPSLVQQYSRHLCLITWGSIGQSRFICQVLCTGIQGISAVSGGSISQRRFICQVLGLLVGGGSIGRRRFICQVLVLLVGGVPSAEEGSSVKFELTSKFTPASQRSFHITFKRPKRLLEILSSHSFNLYYLKGKGMVLTDFLSRQRHDDSNPHKIIPISFNMQGILQSRYYNLGDGNLGKYLAQTRSQMQSSSIRLPEVQGIGKGLDLNTRKASYGFKT